MVRPRVFVSSTYYDLRHIRNYLQAFLEDMGFDPVLFERGDIPYSPDTPLDESCYEEITNCHMLILIIGGHYGNPTSEDINKMGSGPFEFYNSVTKSEFEKALKLKIPIFIFVDKAVNTEFQTYKKNRTADGIQYAHVDSINIFKLLDEILAKQRSIFIQPFENFEDISEFLREQFAGLFADFLSKRKKERELIELEQRISELKEITESLKGYTESIMKKIQPEDYDQIITSEQRKIQLKSASRFLREGLIHFILKSYPDNKKLDELEVFHIFEKAKNLREFCHKMNIDNEYEAFIKGGSVHEAENEFDSLKEKYFL
ncbi:DUF4062 domain-containing protein [Methanoregula sp. UBA64]|jgi:hypothetical protein|uniref:DUF4062 domain-containing protein n=1 Tax=Methanoregula sp. UBA64 TaxID=1915554 RepID=UPI0025E80BF2|nr:DUF4062 domain-containing protein [Methanoregula sp. UBA64]